MASDKGFLDFVLEQLSGIGGITCRKMMGEYIIYLNGKIAASISAKIPRKYPADRCKAVFAERIFVKASKNAYQILAYLKVVLRSIGGNKPAKTDVGSTPQCLCC